MLKKYSYRVQKEDDVTVGFSLMLDANNMPEAFNTIDEWAMAHLEEEQRNQNWQLISEEEVDD